MHWVDSFVFTLGLCTRVLLSARCARFSGDSSRFLAASERRRFSSVVLLCLAAAATGGFGGVAATGAALGCCGAAFALVTCDSNE